ncbi:glycoside hydrolase family 6 protein [Streptomyces coeruleoprunus]|uniref:Glucanase n=1 Tax=Streptomyces coeruleoprunus TaxID=285563 RepID=A0ABV9XBK0_9ACTN
MSGVRTRRRRERLERRRARRRHAMAAMASTVVAVGAVSGLLAASDDTVRRPVAADGSVRQRVAAPASPRAATVPAPQSPPVTRHSPAARPAPTAPGSAPPASSARPAPGPGTPGGPRPQPRATPPEEPLTLADHPLYRHPGSHVLDWVRSHPEDPRRPLIESRIAEMPAAVWFTAYDPATITARVRAVTAGAEAARAVPVVVPYAVPDRDCGGASRGGAPDHAAYDAWMRAFARGLGSGHVIVVLEPDSLALADCLTERDRAARHASLARAARTLKAANPKARVYFDAGHSGWHPAATMAAGLRAAGAAAYGDGIFTNVSNFHRTGDEVAYARRVLAALGGPSRLGAVVDTSRNGNGAPAPGQWCDPAGRALGQPPTTGTGATRIDAYLWIKLPGESDGCRGPAGSFAPDYAYALARG